MRDIDYIVVHCSDMDAPHTVADIDSWHKKRGFNRIGYHYIIDQQGELHEGRDEKEVGAHVKNFNRSSIGICVMGRHNFTSNQMDELYRLITDLLVSYPKAKVKPHNFFDKHKTCPNFEIDYTRFVEN